jgi:hypothetical protein
MALEADRGSLAVLKDGKQSSVFALKRNRVVIGRSKTKTNIKEN